MRCDESRLHFPHAWPITGRLRQVGSSYCLAINRFVIFTFSHYALQYVVSAILLVTCWRRHNSWHRRNHHLVLVFFWSEISIFSLIICFWIFYVQVPPFKFLSFYFHLKHFQFFLVYALDFSVQVIYHTISLSRVLALHFTFEDSRISGVDSMMRCCSFACKFVSRLWAIVNLNCEVYLDGQKNIYLLVYMLSCLTKPQLSS